MYTALLSAAVLLAPTPAQNCAASAGCSARVARIKVVVLAQASCAASASCASARVGVVRRVVAASHDRKADRHDRKADRHASKASRRAVVVLQAVENCPPVPMLLPGPTPAKK